MFQRTRQRQPGAPVAGIWYREGVRLACGAWLRVFYGFRRYGMENIPSTGPVLIVSNHQSFIDPVAIGVGGWPRRMFWAMARASLFRNRLFGGFIASLNALPVERGEADMKAIRGAIELLKHGQAMLVFAEGTRTDTGETKPFQSGIMLLVRRSNATVVPAAIEGAYDVWPRTRRRPKLTGRIRLQFGAPIPAEQLLAMEPQAAMAMLRDRVEALRQELAAP